MAAEDAPLIMSAIGQEVADVLGVSRDGLSRLLRLADGSIVAEGTAVAPSDERAVRYSLVQAAPEPRQEQPLQVRTALGSVLTAHSRYEEARSRGLRNYGKPSGTVAPWNVPKPDPEAEAAKAAHHARLAEEERQREIAFGNLGRWKPTTPVIDEPHPAVGSFADPATLEYVTDKAFEAVGRARAICEALALGLWREGAL